MPSHSSDELAQPASSNSDESAASTNAGISESEEELDVMGRLIPRADVVRVRTVIASGCTWNSVIEGNYTKPLWLVVGISMGAAAGMILFSFTFYQYGKVAKAPGGAGGMPMGGGGAPPPA